VPTSLAGLTLVVNAGVSYALYKPLGIGGVVLGTAVASAVMTVAQAYWLRRELHGFEIGRTLRAVAAMLGASALLGVIAYGLWHLLDDALGRSLLAQFVSVTAALGIASAVYGIAVLALRIPEAQQIAGLVRRRFGRAS
jgi:putative peptidoglycan lipid II flippase